MAIARTLTPDIKKQLQQRIDASITAAKIKGVPVDFASIMNDPYIKGLGNRSGLNEFVQNAINTTNASAGLTQPAAKISYANKEIKAMVDKADAGDTSAAAWLQNTLSNAGGNKAQLQAEIDDYRSTKTTAAPTAPVTPPTTPLPGNPNAPEGLPNVIDPTQPVGGTDQTGMPMITPSVDGYNGGIATGSGEAGKSAAQILAEADLAKQLREQQLETTKTSQSDIVARLKQTLEDEAKTQYERSLPSLYEDLNSRGLLRSSELGTQMAKKQGETYQDLATALAKTQLGYDDSNLATSTGITESYLGGRGSALQREMSLEDYARQLEASKALGAVMTPVSSGSSKSASDTALQLGGTALGGYMAGVPGAKAGSAASSSLPKI